MYHRTNNDLFYNSIFWAITSRSVSCAPTYKYIFYLHKKINQ